VELALRLAFLPTRFGRPGHRQRDLGIIENESIDRAFISLEPAQCVLDDLDGRELPIPVEGEQARRRHKSDVIGHAVSSQVATTTFCSGSPRTKRLMLPATSAQRRATMPSVQP